MSRVTRFGVDYLRRVVQQRIGEEGLRPFSARTGIPVGQLRSLLQGRAARSTTLELMSSVLGLEFYIGPSRRGKLGRSGLPPEIAKALHLSREADVAEAIEVIDKDTLASKLREGIGVVQDLMEQAATAAELLPRLGSGEFSPADMRPADTVVLIPFAADVRPADGSGELAFCKLPEMSIAVATDALASWARPERLTCLRAAGDSMKPTIHDGDLVAVDAGRTAPVDDALFALQLDGGVVVKRLHQADQDWFVTSDNPAYRPRPLSERDPIVGQVAWCQPHGRNKH